MAKKIKIKNDRFDPETGERLDRVRATVKHDGDRIKFKGKAKYTDAEGEVHKVKLKSDHPVSEPEPVKLKHDKPEINANETMPKLNTTTTTQGQDANHNLDNDGYATKPNPDKPLPVRPNTTDTTPPSEDTTPPSEDTTPPSEDVTPPSEDTTPPVPDSEAPTPGGIIEWLNGNWKTIAIVAGAAALIAGIVSLIKGLNKTIKVRYNKVVRTLQRAQKDFTMSEKGLDMRDVMPGVGSKIFDKIANLFTWKIGNGKKNRTNKGAIGIHPFCAQYKEEIAEDLRAAQTAFSKIKVAGDEVENGTEAERQNSSVDTKIYDSFYEALNADALNEDGQLNEIGAMAAISMAMSLGSLAVKGGKFLIHKYKDGKPEGEAKVVQVTKQSTREICYAIINNYASKYINMQKMFSELGISSESLADLDMSSCDKLAELLKKYKKPESNKITSEQYARIKKAWDNMLKHYYNIGDGIISNFVKYTKADNEKDDNLLTASKEKLQNMWDSQKEIYNNNFSRVVVEIVGSYSAIAYNDFIVEKVIPVFKSGLAGDADYVLDAMPKKGEYFVLRQTEGQPWMKEVGEKQMGNTAIAEVTGFDKDKKEVTFKLIARLENDGNLVVDDKGIAEVNGDVNYDFYTDGDGNTNEETLGYGKWLALDPALTDWRPVGEVSVIKEYTNDKGDRYVVYGEKDARDKEEGFSIIYVGLIKQGMLSVSSLIKIELTTHITKEGFESVFEKVKVKFGENDSDVDVIKRGVNNFKGESKDEKAGDTDAIAEIINNFIEGAGENKGDADSLYTLNYTTAENEKQTMVVFSKTAENKEDSISNVYIAQKKADANEFSAVYKVDVNPELLKTKFAEIFSTEDRIKNEQGVVFKFNPNDADENITKTVSETENPNQENATNDDDIVAIIARLLSGCKANEEGEDGGDTPYDEILKKLDEIAKLIEEGFAQQAEALKKLQEFKEFPGLQISINPWNVEIGIKDAEGNDINVVVYTVYQESTKTTAYLIGFTGMDPVNFAIVGKLDAVSIIKEVKRLIVAIKKGRRGLVVIKGYFDKQKTFGNKKLKAELDKLVKVIANHIVFVPDNQQGQQQPQQNTAQQGQQSQQNPAQQGQQPQQSQNASYEYNIVNRYVMNEAGGQQNGQFQLIQPLNKKEAEIADMKGEIKDGNGTVTFTANRIMITKPGNTSGWQPMYVTYKFKGLDGTVELFDATHVHIQPTTVRSGDFVGGNKEESIRNTLGGAINSYQRSKEGADCKIEDIDTYNSHGGQQNSSIEVRYSHKVMNEGVSTSTVITRHFKNFPKNCYVLSESYFDLGNDTSKLSNSLYAKRLRTRGQVFGYVKSNLDAKIFNLTESQTYKVSSYTGYRPSVMTPLYENVYVVKFNDDDTVSTMKYLGKFKIQ